MPRLTYPPAMLRLVNELSRLPSIGEKTAVRLAYHLLTHDPKRSEELATSIREALTKTRLCEECFALTEDTTCSICKDEHRVRHTICVVEKPADVIAIERSSGYHGLYHVLHGLWSPLRGVAPEDTRLGDLLARLRKNNSRGSEYQQSDNGHKVEELVLATGTTVEGDATALYIANSISDLDIKVTRIAQGLPKGGELEYADEITLSHALEGRRRL